MTFFRRKSSADKTPPLPPNRRRSRPSIEETAADGAEGTGGAKARGKRILMATLRIAASAAITAATLWAGFAAYRHATTSPYFAATEFEIKGLRRLTEDDILAAARIKTGSNIFTIDCERAKKNLEDHLWILEAAVKRRLPRSVDVTITERRAVAMVLFDVPYLVDDLGDVFKRWVTGDPIPFPMLTGFPRKEFASDKETIVASIRDALDLAKRYRKMGLGKTAPLAEIHHEVDGSLSLVLDGEQVYVRFGKGPYRKKLKRLAVLLRRLRNEGKQAEMIFFDNSSRPNKVTVRLKPSPSIVPEAASEAVTERISTSDPQKRMSKI
ncbi:MAG: FtsQ-type POTRA domain-containing protein [Myxococcota bacterium]|nr:FtsQ-type POTRA domain-containing protein [Myxococcota bacterium]